MSTTPPAKKQKNVGGRTMTRMYAVMAAYALEKGVKNVQDVLHDFMHHIIDSDMFEDVLILPDDVFLQQLIQDTVHNAGIIDAAIHQHLNVPLIKVSSVLRAILRVGACEVLLQNTPVQVAINEYIEVTRAFLGDAGRHPALVNGVLDAVYRHAQKYTTVGKQSAGQFVD